ncbi:MAG: DUF488 domain-containing protein [Conexivisphaerales archaeon]
MPVDNTIRPIVFTIGHSTRPFHAFQEILLAHQLRMLFDIRTIPRSRYNPQYNGERLELSLKEEGIKYRHLKQLGGLRRPADNSVNIGWRNLSFRGFADYMQTADFISGLEEVISAAAKERVAIMCAEGNPYRCHRSLVGDALLVRGIAVIHLSGVSSASYHRLTPFAKVKGLTITYPAEKQERKERTD